MNTPPAMNTDIDLAPLQARLVAEAEAAGLLDLAYRTLDTPAGRLLLATSPVGLVRVAYETENHESVLNRLAHDLSPRILEAPRRLDEVARQLDEYFAGSRKLFELPLDLSLSAGFRQTVLTYLPSIAYGHTASYRAVAAGVHNPKAVRAVGSACANNPLPIVIPCHRVIRSDGALGAYLAGPDTKRWLLALEGAS